MAQTYQLKIELRDSQPKIWRRVQVDEKTTFSDLHDIIQLAMGWENSHFYEFDVKKTRVYDFEHAIDDGSDPSQRDSIDTLLNDLITKPGSKFTYLYDYGDHWEHIVELENILPKEEENDPVCVAGKGACPQEDCGGIWQYQRMLDILTDQDHPEYEEVLQWLGKEWDTDYFNLQRTNEYLKNYAEQWRKIYAETDEAVVRSEKNDSYDPMAGLNQEDEEYESTFHWLTRFTRPEDIFNDDEELSEMKDWIEEELERPASEEFKAFERLRNLGFDNEKSERLILQALAIEWYFDWKYGVAHLEDRYAYNLQHLPEAPQEFTRLQDALAMLNSCTQGIPFSAIEYLQNDRSETATSSILKALRNHSNYQYYWADRIYAPFWYALAAEEHLCEEMIDPVIQLYEANAHDSDWLFDQGQILIGKLAQKYPDKTVEQVLEAMERDAEKSTKPYIFYLFDAFYFGDAKKYKDRLLALLKRESLPWYESLASTVAELGITEGLPILKTKLKNLRLGSEPAESERWQQYVMTEVEEAILILEGKVMLDDGDTLPLFQKRTSSWKDELERKEELFYEESYGPGFSSESSFDNMVQSLFFPPPIQQPITKAKKPSRNDPCPCGSGKKYKKCCMD